MITVPVTVSHGVSEYFPLLLRHLLPLVGGSRPEELRHDEPPGETPYEDPVSIEPGQGDGG